MNSKVIPSQQLIGCGAALAVYAYCKEFGAWIIALGVVLYIIGIIIGQGGE